MIKRELGARCALLLSLCVLAGLPAAEPDPALLLESDGLLDAAKTLPLVRSRTSVVFRGEEAVAGFNLHSYLAHFDGRFFAMWSSARVGEEDPDQFLRFSTSEDGHKWAPSRTLASDPDGSEGPARWIARGFVVQGGKLHALGALVKSAEYRRRGEGVVWDGLQLMRFTWDGNVWKESGVFAGDCMNNFAPLRVGSACYLPCRDRNMSVYVAASESCGPPWQRLPVDEAPPVHRLDEPTIYQARDGTVHLVIRDGARSGKLVRSVSRDGGNTWSRPVHTNYPDATSKNFTGRLGNGTYILINNPDPKSRDPLAITTSPDGWSFGWPLAIRKNAPARRYFGRAKGSGSLQYPHALEHAGSLWVIYSTNKEDIEITEIRMADLMEVTR